MNILVLGGSGFIGTHLSKALAERGHYVRVFGLQQNLPDGASKRIEYWRGDFSDAILLSEALNDIDVVCHLISSTVPGTSNLDMAEDVRSNLINTLQLLDLMIAKNIRRIVYFSSGGTVYGTPSLLPIPEEHALNPICSYGIVKVSIEKYLYMYQQVFDFKPLILRPSNPYGTGQSRLGMQGLIGTFLGKALDNKPLEVWGDGTAIRDYIAVGDLVDLAVSALESEVVGVFNVGSGVGHSVNEIIEIVRSIVPGDIKVVYQGARGIDVEKIILDINKIKEHFEWTPKVALDEGMKRYYDSLCVDRTGGLDRGQGC